MATRTHTGTYTIIQAETTIVLKVPSESGEIHFVVDKEELAAESGKLAAKVDRGKTRLTLKNCTPETVQQFIEAAILKTPHIITSTTCLLSLPYTELVFQ